MKSILIVLLLCCGMGAWAENIIKVSSTEGSPGDEVTVSVSLENSDALSSMQLSIPLDENLTFVVGSAQVGSRCAGHSLTVGVKDDVLNLLLYSTSMATISGNSGVLASFKLKLGNHPTTISLKPSKTVLTTATGSAVAGTTEGGSVTIRCAKAQYSTMEVDFGAVPIRSTYTRTVTVTNLGNADLTISSLNFSDVNVFSSTTGLPFTVNAGSSKELNITYAPVERGEITKTLKVECNSSSKLNTIQLKAQPFAVNELHLQDVSGISDEEVTIKMTMNNMDAISGLQMEFNMPEQIEYVDGSFELSNRKADHQAIVRLTGKQLKVIAYSPTGKTFTGEDGEIGSFKVKLVGKYNVTLTPTKTVLTATINDKVENVVSKVYGSNITIKYPSISADNSLDFGAVPVTESCEKTFTIRNYGNTTLTINRIAFNDENFSVKETLPLSINQWGSAQVTVVYNSIEQKAFEALMQIYNNDPEKRVFSVKVKGSRYAPNFLTAKVSALQPHDTLKVNMEIDNDDDVSGLQFDLEYPNQYYAPFDDNIVKGTLADGMTITSREMSSNTIRYFCYFLNVSNIPKGKGELFTIMFAPKSNVPLGEYGVKITNMKLVAGELANKNSGESQVVKFTVEPQIKVIITDVSREYGQSNPKFEYTTDGGTLNGKPDISCDATATSPVGTYEIIASKGSITNNLVVFVNGTLTITKAPLVVKAGTYTRKQGEDNPEFMLTYEGFKNNDTEDVLTEKPVVTTTAIKESAPGEYKVTVSGGEAKNYELSYINGKLIVTDADAVVVTAKSYTRIYGDANPTFEYTSEGATLVGAPEITCEATATSPVGTYPIVIKKGTVTNYNDTYINGTLTITKAPLAVKTETYTRKQGEDNPEFTLTYEGWKNNETEEVLTKKPTATTTATKESEPGEYEVTISGGEATNYELSYTNGKLTITEADPVTITAKSYSREYGEANPTFEFTSEGATLVGVPEITCEATATSPVGTYPIVIEKGTVTNYNDTYIHGTLTITKAPLTVKVENVTREQYLENPEFVIIYTGWKLNDDENVLTKKPTATTTATKESPVGEYEIVVSGGEAKNYELSYENGILTVTESTGIATISVTHPVNVYNVQGRMVRSKATTLDGLPKGVYIVNGRKVIVR